MVEKRIGVVRIREDKANIDRNRAIVTWYVSFDIGGESITNENDVEKEGYL